jgi:hypothetical protein
MRHQGDRVAYLITKQAKVVAMTCTHAALKRREFLNLGLKYDNIVMEEAGQVCGVTCSVCDAGGVSLVCDGRLRGWRAVLGAGTCE